VAVDAHVAIYQFLSIIRQPDGTPLRNRRGEVTSHLSGLLYRLTNLLEGDIRPVMVFDGKPPDFKAATLQARQAVKEKAQVKYEKALAAGDEAAAFKYAQATSRVTQDVKAQSRHLLELMGLPWLQAPSEGEAQAAQLVREGSADMTGSQDYDALLFGSPVLVRNVTVTGRRKLPGRLAYVDVKPEIMELAETLDHLGITREQLVDLALLVGTDFNPGIKGIGPKKALALLQEHGDLHGALESLGQPQPDWDGPRRFMLEPPVQAGMEFAFGTPDKDGVIDFLCGEHDFSRERVGKALERLERAMEERRWTGGFKEHLITYFKKGIFNSGKGIYYCFVMY